MAKSAGVLNSTIKITDNILIQESIYSFVDGFDAKRKNEPSGISKKEWTWVATIDDGKKTANGTLWLRREIFVKTDRVAFIRGDKLKNKEKDIK